VLRAKIPYHLAPQGEEEFRKEPVQSPENASVQGKDDDGLVLGDTAKDDLRCLLGIDKAKLIPLIGLVSSNLARTYDTDLNAQACGFKPQWDR
jgi:hypothetical protein